MTHFTFFSKLWCHSTIFWAIKFQYESYHLDIFKKFYKFAKLQVNKWHERDRYNSSKIGKYFLVYQTETKKIMYHLLRACTQKYSDTFWSKKYHITTASTYVHLVRWYFRHEHRRYLSLFNEKKYQYPSIQTYAEGDHSTHSNIVRK